MRAAEKIGDAGGRKIVKVPIDFGCVLCYHIGFPPEGGRVQAAEGFPARDADFGPGPSDGAEDHGCALPAHAASRPYIPAIVCADERRISQSTAARFVFVTTPAPGWNAILFKIHS